MAAAQLYHYDPSFIVALVALGLFFTAALVCLLQILRCRTWFFIPFFFGCAGKFPTQEVCEKSFLYDSIVLKIMLLTGGVQLRLLDMPLALYQPKPPSFPMQFKPSLFFSAQRL